MSGRGSKETRLVLGASPRVDLLPPEVADRKRGAAVRRGLILGVLGAVVLSAGGYAAASVQAIDASAKYDDARLETTELLAAQSEYANVSALSQQIGTVSDARQAGAMTEIDWQAFYQRVVPTLPAGMTIDTFAITSGSPILALAAPVLPGERVRAADVAFVVSTSSLESAQAWIVALKNLPEYGGATPTTINRDENGVFSVQVRLAVTDAAYSHRFAPVAAETAEAETQEGGN